MDIKNKIPLRQFYKNIDDYIINQASDVAISYSKYLLESYPKNIIVYQLLGKAYLDLQHYDTALIIFEKILEIEPDDFVSHVGISLISESFGNLKTALSSMKRAYELQPSNESLQKEVQRLIEAKDGFAPEKVRLTRGALIKMYARSKLAEQAIAEARIGIHEAPNRIDYKVQLADMLLVANKNVEAAELCTEILQTNPFCKPVLEILYRAFSASGNYSDAELYKSRLSELDPYYIFMKPDTNSVNDIPDIAIMIEECDIPESKIDDINNFLHQTWAERITEPPKVLPNHENDWNLIVDEATANNGIGAPILNTNFEEVEPDEVGGASDVDDAYETRSISKREKFKNKLTSSVAQRSEPSDVEIPEWILSTETNEFTQSPDNKDTNIDMNNSDELPILEGEAPKPDKTTDFEEDGMTDHLVPVNPVIENEEFLATAIDWKKDNNPKNAEKKAVPIPSLDDTQRIKVIKSNSEAIVLQLKTALEENDMEFASICINSLVSKKYQLEEVAIIIEEYLSNHPEEIELWLLLVRIFRSSDKKDKALGALEKAQLNISL